MKLQLEKSNIQEVLLEERTKMLTAKDIQVANKLAKLFAQKHSLTINKI